MLGSGIGACGSVKGGVQAARQHTEATHTCVPPSPEPFAAAAARAASHGLSRNSAVVTRKLPCTASGRNACMNRSLAKHGNQTFGRQANLQRNGGKCRHFKAWETAWTSVIAKLLAGKGKLVYDPILPVVADG